MSYFDEPNRDAFSVSIDSAARGPRVGFLESFATGWNAQVRSSAAYGIEDQMFEEDNNQYQRMRRAGIENVPALAPDALGFFSFLPGPPAGSAYIDTARFYEDGGDPANADRLKDYDKRILDLRTKYPELNLQTSREMWDGVRNRAREYEERLYNDRRTLGGSIGSFAGSAIGGMNPDSDPLNFVTLPLAPGRSILGRIAGQGLAQGLVEGINQITGVQEERRLLGVDYGVGDAFTRIGGAAIGGAALQAVGEGAALGVRRWFLSKPKDIAPPPTLETLNKPRLPDTSAVPPQAIPADEGLAAAKLVRSPETYNDHVLERALSRTPAERARSVLDLDYVTTRLNDWDGTPPWALAPKTDTAVTLPRSDFIAPDLHPVAEVAQVGEIARRVDPETFRKYDDLNNRRTTLRQWINDLGDKQNADVQRQLEGINDQIDTLTLKAEDQGGKRAAKTRKEIAALRQKQQEIVAAAASKEPSGSARVRSRIIQLDEQMRDLAPLVSRAYARARGKWSNTNEDRQALVQMMRSGNDAPLSPEVGKVIDAAEASLVDRASILQQTDKIVGKIAKDADATDIAVAVVAANKEQMDDAIDAYRGRIEELSEGQEVSYTTTDLRARLKEGGDDAGALSDEISREVDETLKAKGSVTIYPDLEKGVKIVSVDRGMMADAKGQRYGLIPLLSSKRGAEPVIEIKGSPYINVPGSTYKLHLDNDKITVPNENGEGNREISVRELLEENKLDEQELEAVSSCSLSKTS